MMKIAEIYNSRQGEGFLTGVESTFVRTSGCNLRCWFCDTPYTSWQPEGEDLSLDEILARVEELARSHVVITVSVPSTTSLRCAAADRVHRGKSHCCLTSPRYPQAARAHGLIGGAASGYLRGAPRNPTRRKHMSTDAITVLKWQQIYQALENVTDACEDVANVIEGVVLGHA